MIYFITYYTEKNHVFILNVKMNVNVTVEQQLSILMIYCSEATTGGVLWKKVFLKISQNSQENTCVEVSFIINLQASVFACEFCENYKNTFFAKHF